MVKNLIIANDDSEYIINNIGGFTKINFSESRLSRLYIYGYMGHIPCKVSLTGKMEDIENYKNHISNLSDDYYAINSYLCYCELDEKGYWNIHD